MTQWIAGRWQVGEGQAMKSLNPYTSEVVWQGLSATAEQVELAVSAARAALVSWRNTPVCRAPGDC